MKLGCGILLGGKSRRMERNKAFLELNHNNFLEIIIKELRHFDHLLVSVDQLEKYKNLPYDLVEDMNESIGPIEGIRQIIRNSSTFHVFICACDMPFIKHELIDYMTQFISSDYDCYVIKNKERIHPLCAIYTKETLPVIEEMINAKEYRLMELLSRMRTKYIDINQSCYSEHLLRNINTKEEYSILRRPFIFCVSGVKNSGKTSLILGLIKEWETEYKRIGVIKHDGHDFVIDREGTDTSRFIKAGVLQVSIFSSVKSATIRSQSDTSLESMIDKMGDMDIIIIEGMKNSNYPKVEVIRKEISEQLVCNKDTLIAVASDSDIKKISTVPLYDLNAYKEIAKRVMEYFNPV